MTGDAPETGRRAAHKEATRAALRRAAWQLFATQGFERTTVREIADAAEVTERTFYRYFDGKEGLLADEAMVWIDALHRAITGRPAAEPPFEAIRRALLETAGEVATAGPRGQFWRALEGLRPLRSLHPGSPRPLRRIEESIADAVRGRLGCDPTDPDSLGGEGEYRAQLLGRVAVAALRSAVIRHRQLQSSGEASPGIEALLGRAFTDIQILVGPTSS